MSMHSNKMLRLIKQTALKKFDVLLNTPRKAESMSVKIMLWKVDIAGSKFCMSRPQRCVLAETVNFTVYLYSVKETNRNAKASYTLWAHDTLS